MARSAWIGWFGLLCLTGMCGGAPLPEGRPTKGDVDPLGQTTFLEQFAGQKRACVILIGDGNTCLGMYVFDRWGNCIARDDTSGAFAARDDLAVEWFPADAGPYAIDVRNFGRSTNEFIIVKR